MQVLFTQRAEQQIDHLYGYIADHSGEERADRYLRRIITFCEGLSTFPYRGAQRDDLLPGLRVIGFERRVTIAFSVASDTVLIEGIFYGGQNVFKAWAND